MLDLESITCVKCGKELPVDAVFCTYCGAAVEKPVNQQAEEPEKELIRPRHGRVAGGVAAAMSNYFGLPVVALRIGFVVLSIVTFGLVALLYVALVFIIPQEKEG